MYCLGKSYSECVDRITEVKHCSVVDELGELWKGMTLEPARLHTLPTFILYSQTLSGMNNSTSERGFTVKSLLHLS